MQFLPIFSSLVLSLSLISTSNANIQGQHINHNANARHHSSHARMLEARELYHANSISRARDVNGSRKMVKKATKDQIDYQQKFDQMNSEWQAAAQESLKNGQTPEDYNSFSKAHGGVSVGPYSDGNSGSSGSSNDNSSGSSSSSKSDSGSSEKAAAAPKSNKAAQKAQSNSSSDSGSHSDKSDKSSSQDKDPESKPSSTSSSEAPKKTSSQSKGNDNSSSGSGSSSNSGSGSSSNSGSSNSSGSGILSGLKNILTGGQGTFFTPGLGSCGGTNSDSDYIVALSAQLMDQFSNGNPNTNPLCGKKIKVEYQGKEVEAEVVDTCPPCAFSSIDFSPAAFNQLALPEVGRIYDLKWAFVDGTKA